MLPVSRVYGMLQSRDPGLLIIINHLLTKTKSLVNVNQNFNHIQLAKMTLGHFDTKIKHRNRHLSPIHPPMKKLVPFAYIRPISFKSFPTHYLLKLFNQTTRRSHFIYDSGRLR